MNLGKLLGIIGIILISIFLLVAARNYFSNPSTTGSGNIVQDVNAGNDKDAQVVNLGIKDYNYYPNTITVKADQPVSITLDSSVYGCYRSFTIKELSVSVYSRSPSQTIDFTPTKKGRFRFSCSMGMGYGTLIVE